MEEIHGLREMDQEVLIQMLSLLLQERCLLQKTSPLHLPLHKKFPQNGDPSTANS